MSANNNYNGDADGVSSDDSEFTDVQVDKKVCIIPGENTNIKVTINNKKYDLPVDLPNNSRLKGYVSKKNLVDIFFRGQITSSSGCVFSTGKDQQGVNRYIKLNEDEKLYQLDDGRYDIILSTKKGTPIHAVYEVLYDNADDVNSYDNENIKFNACDILERIYVDNKQLNLSEIEINRANLISSLLQDKEDQEKIAKLAYIKKYPLFKVEKVEKNMLNKKRDHSPDNGRGGGSNKSMLNLGSQSNKKIKGS